MLRNFVLCSHPRSFWSVPRRQPRQHIRHLCLKFFCAVSSPGENVRVFRLDFTFAEILPLYRVPAAAKGKKNIDRRLIGRIAGMPRNEKSAVPVGTALFFPVPNQFLRLSSQPSSSPIWPSPP